VFITPTPATHGQASSTAQVDNHGRLGVPFIVR
jgi:hypothetical protein